MLFGTAGAVVRALARSLHEWPLEEAALVVANATRRRAKAKAGGGVYGGAAPPLNSTAHPSLGPTPSSGFCGASYCSDQIIAFASVLFWLRMFEALSVQKHAGPLVNMIIVMIRVDLINFLQIASIMLIGWTITIS